MTVFQELEVDHGLTVPLSVYCPEPGDAWPCPVVPLLVNVIQYPQPTAARCYALGQALGRAIRELRRRTGSRCSAPAGCPTSWRAPGGVHQPRVRRDVPARPSRPTRQRLAALSREDYVREAGSEGIEMIMWLIMRGAMRERIRRVHDTYFVPASNTAAAMALFDNSP